MMKNDLKHACPDMWDICDFLAWRLTKVVHFLPCKPVGPTENCKQTKATVCVELDSVPVFISSAQTCIAHISGARIICLVTFDSCTAMRYIQIIFTV